MADLLHPLADQPNLEHSKLLVNVAAASTSGVHLRPLPVAAHPVGLIQATQLIFQEVAGHSFSTQTEYIQFSFLLPRHLLPLFQMCMSAWDQELMVLERFLTSRCPLEDSFISATEKIDDKFSNHSFVAWEVDVPARKEKLDLNRFVDDFRIFFGLNCMAHLQKAIVAKRDSDIDRKFRYQIGSSVPRDFEKTILLTLVFQIQNLVNCRLLA
ncbi:hypothetical protein GUJ93_ZPchr0004g40038 [Zizania palustris]|uniref:Uncharacterized protein n=1 Tax=Zizania palustris TaxID=103762 RepID=A0A8J5SGW8_ZIZPA|nr:hypothetical protein GUJ93_ZPchr0004g40038 [Zizania palustris]